MAWHDGELFPVEKNWLEPPYQEHGCPHDHVVAPKDKLGRIANPGTGRMALWCADCDTTWWEPLGNVKGSPWEGK